MKKHYLIYKITNTINNKIYIGKHETENINDGYMGSGKHLLRSIYKHGIDKFKKEILYNFDNYNDMNLKEAEIVNEEFINRKDTYNIKLGGQGGLDHINTKHMSNKQRSNISRSIKYRYEKDNPWRHCKHNTYGMLNKHHSDKSKLKISVNNKMLLDKNEFIIRKNDFNNIEKTRGYIKQLSQRWHISQAQVGRYIKKYFKDI